ncbi:hypothetical protein [Bacillus massiliglaciei]|uniref:hypothetical protein n=1 Tax=Bacillus massiliglaciei TaxID=1816693 RepID=UPI001F453DDF|nr:hypothetical protein [Bacillus massiliglaciei]
MKQRLFLCFLLCMVMLFLAMPYLDLEAGGAEGAFAACWLAFAFLAVAGNLSGLLFAPAKPMPKQRPKRKRVRSFH